MTPPRPRLLARTVPGGAVVEADDRLYLRVDAAGRWTALGEDGATFRRTVEGRILRPRGGGFEACTDAEAAAVHARAAQRADEFGRALSLAAADEVLWNGSREEVLQLLRACACHVGAPDEDRAAFAAAYPEPVPILPPHRYRDLVVLPATGCPNHHCRFCAFYRDRTFRLLDEVEFRSHLHAVRDLFGVALAARDGIFLGSAAALVLPDDVLRARLAAVTEVFGRPRRGVASFHDADRGALRSEAAWRGLRDRGLVEATLGLETGNADLRAAQGKSADLDRFRATVGALRAAGLVVSVTVLVGLGGPDLEEAHLAGTGAVLDACGLGPRDRVYLSPLLEADAGTTSPEALRRWREALSTRTQARLGDYRVERFAWFA